MDLRHWWIHSIWASLLFPKSRRLWHERLHLENDPHQAELAELRSERTQIEREVRTWLEDSGVIGAALKARIARDVGHV